METFLLLATLLEEVRQMQGVSKNNNHNSNTKSRRWTPEDKTRIVMESLTTNIIVAELCRKYNLNPNVFYNWKQKFIEGGKRALSGSSKDNINKDLETENERLKRIIGEQTIAIDAFKKTLETGRKG
ncbi:MAG: transposase [Nitrososphaeraceae archaeon]|nr:transposase [Nitrososphaeraceae archaeon]